MMAMLSRAVASQSVMGFRSGQGIFSSLFNLNHSAKIEKSAENSVVPLVKLRKLNMMAVLAIE